MSAQTKHETATNGPWKWLSYPSGAKLLAGRERAVIHCPDAPMSINEADQAVIALAPEMLALLREWVRGDYGIPEEDNRRFTEDAAALVARLA